MNQGQHRPANIRVFDAIQEYRWMTVGVTALGFLIALVAAFLIQPVYRSQVVLIPSESAENQDQLATLVGQFGGLAAMTGLQLGSHGSKQEAIATLTSRELTSAFIIEHNLLPELFAEKWDETANKWDMDDDKETPSAWDAYAIFDEKVRTVVEDPRSGLVILSIEWTDRTKAADWANLLVDSVNQRMRQKAIEEAEKSIEYLNRELERTSIVELQSAVFRLIESQINKIMLANVREEYAFRVIDPAVVPDEDNFVKPKRVLLVILGLLLGAMFGGLAALLRQSLVRIE